MLIHYSKIIFTAIIISLLVGCVGVLKDIKLDADFWQRKPSKIAIVVTPYPITGNTFSITSHGLSGYSYIISKTMDAELIRVVREYDYSEFYTIKKLFADELAKRGFQVIEQNRNVFQLSAANLNDLEKNNSNLAHVKAFKKQLNADYLILFHVDKCGYVEDNNLSPFRERDGFFSVDGFLLNLNTGSVDWKHIILDFHGVPVSGEWNQSPDYPNIRKAIHEAIATSKNKLYNSFFNMQP